MHGNAALPSKFLMRASRQLAPAPPPNYGYAYSSPDLPERSSVSADRSPCCKAFERLTASHSSTDQLRQSNTGSSLAAQKASANYASRPQAKELAGLRNKDTRVLVRGDVLNCLTY